MSLVLGIDLGTTTLTALALDALGGKVVACSTSPNRAETTSPTDKTLGRSEWSARDIVEQACASLRNVAEQLGPRCREITGLGITGQQHGVVVVDERLRPVTPFINWQDRRAEEPCPGSNTTWASRARDLAGETAPRRAGCRLSAGYSAVTLFWLKEHGLLPRAGTACFVMDYLGSALTGQPPVTDPTCAASSGALDLERGDWDEIVLGALELPRSLFPPVRSSGDFLGGLTVRAAEQTGLPQGLPVFVGIGDNQASFLGSVARRDDTLLVNIGTGGQVTVYAERGAYEPPLEVRPFPRGGQLLVAAGLSGGSAYAVLERFFRTVASQVLGSSTDEVLYTALNRLAAEVPRGADGLRCEPFFSGTRWQPELRANWSGVSAENFTPAHLTRALLEGMARTFAGGQEAMVRQLGRRPTCLVGAGNGVRANPLLARLIAEEMGLPLAVPEQREEAASGAARLAAVGAGVFPDVAAACATIRYEGER